MFYPVYALDSKLQAGKTKEKWKPRARLGIYLGRSPIHARSVALVMDIEKGYVSPQFHVQFDPSFGSVAWDSGNIVPKSYWQVACKFIRSRSSLHLIGQKAGKDDPATFI